MEIGKIVVLLIIGVGVGITVSGGNLKTNQITSQLQSFDIGGPSFQEIASNPSKYEKASISGTLKRTNPGFGVGELYIEKNETRIYVRSNECDLKSGQSYTLKGEVYEISVGSCSGTFEDTSLKWCMEQNRELNPDSVHKTAALKCSSTGSFNIGPDVEEVKTDYTCSEIRTGAAWAYGEPGAGDDAIEMGCKNVCNDKGMTYFSHTCTDGLTCECAE